MDVVQIAVCVCHRQARNKMARRRGCCTCKLAALSMLVLASPTSAILWPEAAPGSNDTSNCDKLYVDVGANIGQSLKWWYTSKNYGRGSHENAKVATWQERQKFCADVFEAEPNQTHTLLQVTANHRSLGRIVRLYAATPFSLMGGDVLFNSIGAVNDAGGTIAKAGDGAAAQMTASNAVMLRSMNAIEYLRSLKATTLALKIDVESYEYELMRGLISSGVLCIPGRRTYLLIEWHVPRGKGNQTHYMFDEKAFGLPDLTKGSGSLAVALRDAMLWMLRSPACANVTAIRWY